MKYVCVSSYARFLNVIFCAVLLLSCASRPAPVERVPPSEKTEIVSPPPIIPPEPPDSKEPPSPFEQALTLVKNNSPLIHKFFRLDTDAGIEVKGECRIERNQFNEGNDFSVSYDLEGVEITDGMYRIAFSMEDTAAGVFRTDELFWSPAADETGLLLSFDDDYWPVWRQYFDVFERFNAKVTFFVMGGLVPLSSLDSPAGNAEILASLPGQSPADDVPELPPVDGSLAAFCAEALGRGHRIGFHTLSHFDLTKVSRAAFERETTGAVAAFQAAGIPFSAFAFPFGFSQVWMQEALLPHFKITRGYGANFRLYDTNAVGGKHIVSKAIDNIMYRSDSGFEHDIRLLLLTAKFIGGIVPFTSHDISDTAQWGIKPARLEYLLRTTQELKLKFYTYADFYADF